MTIRPIGSADLPHLKPIIDATEMFPSGMLDDMIAGYLTKAAGNEDIWFTAADAEDRPVSVAYCAPEQLTEGTWNLYLIAVDPAVQSKGFGRQMMDYLEELLRERGMRILLVETSGLPEFERTRAFYDGCGYTRAAVIPEFYGVGEDKVVFWKKLS